MLDLALLGQGILNGLMKGGIYALLACGLTMVFAVSRIFNFVHGDFMALALYGCVAGFTAWKLEPYVSMIFLVPALFGIGYLVFRFVMRRVLKAHFLLTIQLTLGMVFVIESLLVIVFKADPFSVNTALGDHILHFGSVTVWMPLLLGFVVAVVVLTALYWILARTDFGRSIRATVQNPTAAGLVGINVSKIQLYVFAGGIALAGLAGGLLVPMLTVRPTIGLHLTLMGFIIMVLGGLGNFMGSLVAAIIIGVVESLSAIYIGGSIAAAVPYAIFIAILLLKPEGLWGRA